MEYNYYTRRLNLRVAHPSENAEILDFHTRNRQYFEPFEKKKPSKFYTETYQYNNLTAESISFVNGIFIRYYLFTQQNSSYVIGTISFKQISHDNMPVIRIGYKIDHNEWHKGYAYEALSFILPRAALYYGGCQFEALVQPDNTASVNLLKKIGFAHQQCNTLLCSIQEHNVMHHIYTRIF